MTNRTLSQAEQQRVEQIAKIVEMFRQIINEDDAVENGFYLDGLPPQSLDGMRSWLWVPFEHILEPEEAERFRKLRILLTDPIEVLLDVSTQVTSLEEYSIILRDKFKWNLSNLTDIGSLGYDLLGHLSNDFKRIEQAISIIITTVSRWNDDAMAAHKELLTLFRPDNPIVTHSEIIPMHSDTGSSRTFLCFYPWGVNYISRLQDFLSTQKFEWSASPLTQSTDALGVLIAGRNGNLSSAQTRIEDFLEQFDSVMNPSSEDMSQPADQSESPLTLELSDLNVVSIQTDWKHLEIDGHAEDLLDVGIHLTQQDSESLGWMLFTVTVV